VKLSSNIGAAQDAVSGFTEIDLGGGGQQVSLGSSNISSMHDGAKVANKVLKSISDLVSAVKKQANNVTALATEIEERDHRDAGSWGGKP
jgi:hypothetical protein